MPSGGEIEHTLDEIKNHQGGPNVTGQAALSPSPLARAISQSWVRSPNACCLHGG
jgi:hypothetical protein